MDAPHFRIGAEVAFADTDASGSMHFSNLFRHVERAEHAFLRSLGIEVFDLAAGGWPRVRVECDYRKPLRAGDPVTVEITVLKIGSSSITWGFAVMDAGAGLAATGSMTTVRTDADGRPCAIPAQMRVALDGCGHEGRHDAGAGE